jgi:HEAT repeat protein
MRFTARRSLLITAILLATVYASPAQEPKFLDKDPYYWLDQLKSPNARTRRAGAFALGKLGTATYQYRGITALVEHVVDPENDAEVRDAAAYALGEIALDLRQRRHRRELADVWTGAGDTLLQALSEDKDARVRRSAAFAVGGFGEAGTSGRRQLQTALKNQSPGVRQNAAWALGQLGQTEALETLQALAKVIGDEDQQVRRDAAAAVGDIGRLGGRYKKPAPNPAVSALLQLLRKDKDAVIRKTAIDSLVNAVTEQDKGGAADLRRLLDDKDPEIARGAALALGNIGGAEADPAVPRLREVLNKGDGLMRIQASAALANVGEGAAPAVPDLVRAFDDKEPQIRRNIAIALRNIGPEASSAIPSLARHLRSDEPDEEVRRYSAEALGHMRGADVVSVVPDILRAVKDDKAATVRQRAVDALFYVPDLEAHGIVRAFEAVLEEKDVNQAMVRYDAARCLANRLRDKAPDKAVDVLLEMLKDEHLKIYKGAGTDVTGSSVEGAKGGASVALNVGGDARFLAAQALAQIGARKAGRPDVIRALKEAAKSKDEELSKAAEKALEVIDRK